jgi:starch phosphorylase
MRDAGLDYGTARKVAGAGTLFTTHTPVPAGFDLFSADLVGKYFDTYVKDIGLTVDQLMSLGRMHPHDVAESFNVAALAIRHSPRRNAVSRLHRRVTARMLRESWPDWPDSDIPVASITNGAHTQGWVAGEMAALFDRYLGLRWRDDPGDPAVWERVVRIPDEELWRTHVRQRERLVAFARSRLESQLARRGALPRERQAASEVLGSDVLTIGFARRFATYKRATLVLSQVDRLKAILLDERRPVQLIFAGKAHPKDDAGKELIRQIVHFAREEGLQRRIVFLEDYDLGKARVLVQGADVWLNTPRRPMEASGTSGMKALMNGALNLSVLDGWWAEGHREGVGWAIGTGEEYDDWELQDRVESLALYSILEQQVIPLFYDRGADGLPRGWLSMMKDSMKTLIPAFSSTRMVKEYVTRFYIPAAAQYTELAADGYKRGRELAAWRSTVTDAWQNVAVVSVTDSGTGDVPVGGQLEVEAKVELGALTPGDVVVHAYHGLLSPTGRITGGDAVPLEWVAQEPGGAHVYRGTIATAVSGEHAFSVRVVPSHEGVLIPNEMALIAWE